ncbi:hypothetical protein M422DRAFT_269888 [Sphaerobolus stellatus SS14]|uniref:Unplaced genomic scaffold SPHSTscaffold_223, whole genome shotgun sequence n=1 Tax=Sphaerobolus stellatus (strain SS14) TaxID=990650 RepID=A0A0C9UTY0_SPHS4|nr:hypothetical protein M422DRAFT_269888 [Sphaerobolus stellatus SS14]
MTLGPKAWAAVGVFNPSFNHSPVICVCLEDVESTGNRMTLGPEAWAAVYVESTGNQITPGPDLGQLSVCAPPLSFS